MTSQIASGGDGALRHEGSAPLTRRERALIQALDAHSIVSITDRNRIITYVNDKLCEVTGYSREELLGQHQSIFRTDHYPDEFYADLDARIAVGEVWHGEIQNAAKGGSRFWTKTTVYPVRDEQGEIVEYITVRTDITDRKRAENKLRSAQEQFRKAFHAVPALFAISDPDTGAHYDVNETWMSVLGYSHEEAMARNAVELGIWADPEERRQFVELVKAEGSVRGYDTRFRTKNGELRDMVVSAEYLTVEGQPRLYVAGFDVTERKKVADRLRAVIDHFPGGIAAFDENLVLRLVNDQYYEGLDIPRERFPCGTGYEAIVRFLAERGHYGDVDIDRMVEERKAEAMKCKTVAYERTLSDGTTLAICVFPLPEGGFVSSYSNITERKLSEAQNNRLVQIVENSLNEIYVFDAETLKFLQVNKSACENLGYTREELSELTPYDIKLGFDRESFEAHIAPLRDGRVDHLRFESIHIRRDGSLYDVDVTLQKIPSETRPVFAAIIEDITEKKLADEELQLTRKRFQDIAEVSSDWIWETNEDHRFTYLSERFSDVTGVSTEQIIGKTRYEVGKDAEADWEAHLADLENHRPFRDFQYSVPDVNGRMRHWSISGTPVFDAAGNFRGYRGTGTDHTAEVEARAELLRHRDHLQNLNDRLAREQQRLEGIYANTPVMLHSILKDGTIVEVSNYWLDKMGYSREEVIGKNIFDFMDPENAAYMRRVKNPELFSGKAVDNVLCTYIRKDGSEMEVRLSATTAQGAESDTLQSFTVVFDVTDEMRAKRELEAHRNHLKELVDQATRELKAQAVDLRAALEKEKEYNEQQSQFMYMASHEFRTPLAIIDSSIQRLLRSKDSISADELQARCAKIQRAIGRMSALMESALAAARVDAHADNMEFDDCDLNALVEEICQRQQEISPSHVISFTPGELPPAICANASALDQVFTNLLSNAVKYSPGSPNIEVSSCVEGGEAVVRVRDYGRGIDADDLPKMFRRYFRAKTAQGIAGTGIGLDIARVAVERHGGSISVESEPGRGSVFTVRLPVCGPAAVSESNAA